jgi:hypothetical protein
MFQGSECMPSITADNRWSSYVTLNTLLLSSIDVPPTPACITRSLLNTVHVK